jgi:hypothetical protein
MPQSQKDWLGKCVAVAIEWPEGDRHSIKFQLEIHRVMIGTCTVPDKNMASGPKCEDDLAYCSIYNSISLERPHHIA